jgi:hypothetical protein
MHPRSLYLDLDEAASHLHCQLQFEVKYNLPASYCGTTNPYFMTGAIAKDLVPLLIKGKRLTIFKMPNGVSSLDQDDTSWTPASRPGARLPGSSNPILLPTQTTVDRSSAHAMPSSSITAPSRTSVTRPTLSPRLRLPPSRLGLPTAPIPSKRSSKNSPVPKLVKTDKMSSNNQTVVDLTRPTALKPSKGFAEFPFAGLARQNQLPQNIAQVSSPDHDRSGSKTQGITQKGQSDSTNNRTHVSDSEKDFDMLDLTGYTLKITSLLSRKRPARSVEDLDDEGNADTGDRSGPSTTQLRKRPARQTVKADIKEDAEADSEADIDDPDIFDDIDGSDVEDSDAEFVPKAANKRNRTMRRSTRNTTVTIPSDVKVCNISDSEGSSSDSSGVD